MAHIGKEKDRIELTVKYLHSVEYMTHYSYYGEKHYIHIFATEDGDKIVWKTGKCLKMNEKKCSKEWIYPNEGAVLRIKATVKEHGDYNGEPQTSVSRLTIVELIKDGKSSAEIEAERQAKKEEKIQAQFASLEDGDEIIDMDYRQYKNHYADCETIIDSYDPNSRKVSVIVRDGRMKNNGVRWRHFSRYVVDVDGDEFTFKAVCANNAIKQAKKRFKNAEAFEVVDVYRPRAYFD